jgi:Domain of unknown function (DUF4421)
MSPLASAIIRSSIVFLAIFSGLLVQGQRTRAAFDSAYYQAYPKLVTGRFFFSKKYTGLLMEAPPDVPTLKYRPNTAFSTGVGATYGAITLNLGLNLGFLNPDKENKGKTHSLDLQSHIYTRKLLIDLYGQFYKGYYLSPKGYAIPGDAAYLRPDLRVNLIGLSVYRLFNHRQFSYRAAFLQNEWQKKSAGSLLVGGEAYTGIIKGDSALVPGGIESKYSQRHVNKIVFTEFGPGIGYAYTLVYKEHFFLTGSASLTGDLSFVNEYTEAGREKHTSMTPNITLRGVLGYNSNKWSTSISWINNTTNLRGASGKDQYLIRTGNIRVTIAKRFQPGRLLKKKLRVIDDLPLPK